MTQPEKEDRPTFRGQYGTCGKRHAFTFPEEDVSITNSVGVHGNENEYQWEEFVNNDMDRSPTSDDDLIHAKYSFDGRFVFSLFDKMVHFKEQSTLWEDSFKASDELCKTKDVVISQKFVKI